jgi:pimeloyl-ACP methyl ester carboxylesterase
VARLAAIVLVVDLTNTVDEMASTPWLDQEIDLEFTLGAIRFLRQDKSPDIEDVNLSTLIASRLPRLPRLDVPVLVLFSKADMLGELTNEAPLRFARRRLPRLHASLRTHARRYRFDFVHTMKTPDENDPRAQDPDVKAVQVERPCGVLLSMEWLLTDPFRWMPSLPTRFLEGF